MRFQVICIRALVVAGGIFVVAVRALAGHIVQAMRGAVMPDRHAQSGRDRSCPLEGNRKRQQEHDDRANCLQVHGRQILQHAYSTVTDFARFLGLSTSLPRSSAAWYARSWSGTVCSMGERIPAWSGMRIT